MAPAAADPPSPTLADVAYAHACAVLGPGVAATEAATLGLRRGGRSRSAVLGHTRAAALERAAAGSVEPVDADAVEPAELVDLARLLTFTRPAVERAIVDLDTRSSLDRAALGRALGLPAAAAAARAAEVMLAWQETLDPVVLARLGVGGCDALADLLGPDDDEPRSGMTVGQLLAAGEVVASHAVDCAACRDRLRAMVSVRTLVGQGPIEPAPASVREAAGTARLRPGAPPPPLEPGVVGRAARRWPAAVAAVGAAAVLALIGGVLSQARHNDASTRIEALTKVPAAGTTLEVTPTLVETALPPSLVLRNLSSSPTTWSATSDRPWISVTPDRGRIDAGAFTDVAVSVTDAAPEGELRAAVTFVASDGSTAVARLHTTISHPPDVASTISGCDVTAAVEDESEVSSVALHWREPVSPAAGARTVERSQPMTKTDTGYHAVLPVAAAGQAWWVTATDALGNTARTAEQVLAINSC